MKMRYLVGIDVGTTGMKGVLVDVEGRVLAKEVLEMKGVYAILEAEI